MMKRRIKEKRLGQNEQRQLRSAQGPCWCGEQPAYLEHILFLRSSKISGNSAMLTRTSVRRQVLRHPHIPIRLYADHSLLPTPMTQSGIMPVPNVH